METGHFWTILASIQLSISLFIDLPEFILLFGVIFKNNFESILDGILFTWFVQMIYIIFFLWKITCNSFNISEFV